MQQIARDLFRVGHPVRDIESSLFEKLRGMRLDLSQVLLHHLLLLTRVNLLGLTFSELIKDTHYFSSFFAAAM